MKPILNLDEISEWETNDNGKYGERYSTIGDKIGAKKLGYSLSVVPPGKRVCPFHNHRVNEEMFLIIEGTGLLRFGSKEYAIKKHDIIACPPGDQDVAHQIINDSQEDLRYLCLSTNETVEIVEYPDSNKVMSMIGDYEENQFRHISRLGQSLDYMDGEQ
jgi:uncharacterized cupin superfamily protein